ncbi:MAG: hypothetical protein WA239_04845 [Candidatus Sulfotelmatobacter sp.]|jgi:hypothetical protein
MSPLVRRSILKKFLIVVSCTLPVCVPTTLALAQHPAVRTAGGVVHISAPPISHVPISSAPIIHAPSSTPRISVARSAGALGTAGFRPPRRPIRPFPPVLVVYESRFLFGGPFWGLNSCWWATCDLFWSWTLGYATVSSPGPTNYISQVYETPVYVYGEERPDLPQLFLKDGTILNVTDYWLVDDQLHFTMIEENGTKPAEHVIPFGALDLQTTVDANTRRGFRFMLRNEPFEQYLRDHPEGPPRIVTPPRE